MLSRELLAVPCILESDLIHRSVLGVSGVMECIH